MKYEAYVPEIRFSDIDAMGHVNNAVYFTYFEQARIWFFRQLIAGKWDWNKQGILVARNEMDYMRPVHFNDRVEIHTSCSHIGTKSFTIVYEVRRGDEICAKGKTVLVCFDHHSQRSMVLPDLWRSKLQELID